MKKIKQNQFNESIALSLSNLDLGKNAMKISIFLGNKKILKKPDNSECEKIIQSNVYQSDYLCEFNRKSLKLDPHNAFGK